MSGVLSRNSLEHAVAGSAGTCLASLILFPLDRVKTLIQLDPAAYPGLLAAFLKVLQAEGPRGLYKGCGPMLQTVSISNFLYFFLFEGLKDRLAIAFGQPEGSRGPYETLAASALAGSLNMVVTEPLWRACIVAQAHEQKRSASSASLLTDGGGLSGGSSGSSPRSAAQLAPLGVFGAVAGMWAEEGTSALWRGLGSSLWLVTNPVIQFFAYDMLKAIRLRSTDVSAAEAFLMGALAKALATVLTFPLQVAQSRLRAVRGQASLPPELRGMVVCLQSVYRTNGVAGLYFGLVPKLLQTVTTAAFMFAFYEKIHVVIRRATRNVLQRAWQRSKLAQYS
mmetsp:Transcript_89813/g.257331  ORF Transcript_89813/g.257331 Transcript_89813/m.257331 type:complete len:337 (-) Transcript_89813:30-1040(-)